MRTQDQFWFARILTEVEEDEQLQPLDFSSDRPFMLGFPDMEEFGEFSNHPYQYGDYN